VGGQAAPGFSHNLVARSGASGMVIEDAARGCVADNALCGNHCAAVAVQGSAAPRLERNRVAHGGRGGIWIGERAGGAFVDNLVEECRDAAWRVGSHVTAAISGSGPLPDCEDLAAALAPALPPPPHRAGPMVVVCGPGGAPLVLGAAPAPRRAVRAAPAGPVATGPRASGDGADGAVPQDGSDFHVRAGSSEGSSALRAGVMESPGAGPALLGCQQAVSPPVRSSAAPLRPGLLKNS
jgi:hypothetical protein